LNDLEIAAKQANDEREMRQAELQKKEIQAKLKAEQLKQERIRAEQEEMRLKEAERIKKEQELIAAENQRKLQLAVLKQKVEDKRKSLGDFTYSSLSPAATIKEMQEIDAKILAIKEKYRQVLAKSIEIISKQVNDTFVKASKEVKSEFEPEAEFKARVKKWRDEASGKQSDGFMSVKNRIEQEYNKEVEPFIKALKKLSAQEFYISSNELNLDIGKYDSEKNIFPVSIKSLKSYNGVLPACSANISIPRQEARRIKQHYQNNILRSEIKGNFQSVKYFRISEAFIIDDATNKKYDIFISNNFVDIGNGIIFDTKNKLLWSKNAKAYPTKISYEDTNRKIYKYFRIAELYGWRVPREEELLRMLDIIKGTESSPFVDIQNDWYWTSSEKCGESSVCIKFNRHKNGGISGKGSYDCCAYVWPVQNSNYAYINQKTIDRYDFLYSPFIDIGNGIIFDSWTNRLWSKNAKTDFNKISFADTNKMLSKYSIDELYGWRLPNKEELSRMVGVVKGIDPSPFINILNDWYWSSSEVSSAKSYCIKFHKRKGISDSGTYDCCAYAWPVR